MLREAGNPTYGRKSKNNSAGSDNWTTNCSSELKIGTDNDITPLPTCEESMLVDTDYIGLLRHLQEIVA